jgi:hypothetical protein
VELLITDPVVHPSASLVRRDAPVRFRTWGEPSEDMIYFAELAEHGAFGFLDEPLAGYRKREASVTKKPGNVSRSFVVRRRWIDEIVTPANPEQGQRLLRALFDNLAQQVRLARWQRDWPRYWELREYLRQQWPWPEKPPPVTREWVFAPVIYRCKDALDNLIADRPSTKQGIGSLEP